MAIAKAAQMLACDELNKPAEFCETIAELMPPWDEDFAGLVYDLPRLLRLPVEEAHRELARAGSLRPEFPEPIITPFVVPTVLAALWCVLRSPDSWPKAVTTAIGLGGDVDTLGAIVGALMGARLGIDVIPRHLAEDVLDSERLKGLAVRYHALVMEQQKG